MLSKSLVLIAISAFFAVSAAPCPTIEVLQGGVLSGNTNSAGSNNGNNNDLSGVLSPVFDGNGDGNGNPVASAVAAGNSADQNKLGGLVDSVSKGLSGRRVLDGGVLSGNTNAAGTNNGNDNNLKDVLSPVFSNNGNSNGNPSASNNGNPAANGNSANQNQLGGLVDSIAKGLSGRGIADGGILSGNTNEAGTNNGNGNNLKDVLSPIFDNNGNNNGNPIANGNGNPVASGNSADGNLLGGLVGSTAKGLSQ